MKVNDFLAGLKQIGIEQYYGVPDSTLKTFCEALQENPRLKHQTACNEGAAIGMAAGYYLASGKPAMVYMQNSGIGNIVNPVCSLLHEKVYEIPVLLLVGWRGEPGFHDEPQHLFQGEVTFQQLEAMGITCVHLNQQTSLMELDQILKQAKAVLDEQRPFALIVSKGTFASEPARPLDNGYHMEREEAIAILVEELQDDPVVSTTGKISRELYEQLNLQKQQHHQAFLTVGSMGHASMIGFGLASQLPQKRIWIVDGDGAALMHLGAMATIASSHPENVIHVILNNAAHESVGGMPTCDPAICFQDVAQALGYAAAFRVDDVKTLKETLSKCKALSGPVCLEVLVSLGSRADLGRPKESAKENKQQFMQYLKEGH